MQFTKRLRDGVRSGRITCSIRIWQSPRVKLGHTYPMEEGRILIESIREIALGDVTGDLARRSGLAVVAEAFADRAYTPKGELVSRREAGAVLHDEKTIADRMVQLAREGTLEAIDGSTIRIEAQSICVHGDSPGAVAIAQEIRRRFEAEGIAIRSFADRA